MRLAGAVIALAASGALSATCVLDSEGTGASPTTGTTSSSGGGGSTSTGSGGSGGEGGTGGSQGGGGQGGGSPQVIAEWAATAPDPGTGVYSLPAWLTLESPSSDKTVQTGPDTVRLGFGPNAPRARRVATEWGLNVESTRTNRLTTSRVAQPGWTLFHLGTVTPALGPDGLLLAALVSDTDAANQTAVVEEHAADPSAQATVSAWVAGVTAGNQATIESNTFSNTAPSKNSVLITAQATWQRVSFTGTEGSGVAVDRVRPAAVSASGVGSATFDLLSHETGRYPSSVILTAGAPVTREAEKLYSTVPADLAPGGYFHVVITIAPNYASGEQSFDHDLIFFDPANRAYLRAQDHALLVLAEGATVLSTPPLSWSREQALRIEVANTPAERRLRVTGADGGDVTDASPVAGAFPSVPALHLLGDETGSQECADLRSITFFDPM